MCVASGHVNSQILTPMGVCVQSSGAAEAAVPATQGSGVWSEARVYVTHILPFLLVQSYTKLP